jgi:hypothetical protein
VRGDVNVSYGELACSGSAESIKDDLTQIKNLLESGIYACRATPSFLPSLSADSSPPTAIDSNPFRMPEIQNLYVSSGTDTPIQNLYSANGATPISLPSAFDGAKYLTSTVWGNVTTPVVSASSLPAGLYVQGTPTGGLTLDAIEFTVARTPLATDILQSKALSDLTAGGAGIYQSGNTIPWGAAGSTLNAISLAFTNTVPTISPAPSGSDHLLASNINPYVTANGYIAGIQLPGGVTLYGGSERSTWGFQPNVLMNSSLASTTTIAGTDYTSLSKSLSDLGSGGHVVTGWTVTYFTTDSR